MIWLFFTITVVTLMIMKASKGENYLRSNESIIQIEALVRKRTPEVAKLLISGVILNAIYFFCVLTIQTLNRALELTLNLSSSLNSSSDKSYSCSVLTTLGRVYSHLGRFKESDDILFEVESILSTYHADNTVQYIHYNLARGESFFQQQKYDSAMAVLEKSTAEYDQYSIDQKATTYHAEHFSFNFGLNSR